MNLNDLKLMCEKDVKIDSTDLDGYSISIPTLANKYHQLAFDERKVLRYLQGEYNVLLQQRWLYYSGKASDDAYDKEPFDLKVLRSDVGIYIDSDEELQQLGQKEAYLETTVNYLEKVLREITNRNWTIRNTIEWKKFLHGE